MTVEEVKKYVQGKHLLQNNTRDIKYFSPTDIEAIRFYIVQALSSMTDYPEELFDTIHKDLFKGVQDFLNYEKIHRTVRESTGVKIYDPNCVGAVIGCVFENYLLKTELNAFMGSNGWVEFIKNNDVNVYDIDVALTNTNLQLDIKTKLILPTLKNMPISGTVGLANYQFIMYTLKYFQGKVEDVWVMSRYYYNRYYNGIVFMNIKKLLEYVYIVDQNGIIVDTNNCNINKKNISKCSVLLRDCLRDKVKYSIDSNFNRIEVTNTTIYYNQALSDISGIREFNNYLMDNY